MCHGECRVSFVIVGATGLRNVSTFGKLDPYVKISYGKSVYRTSVIHDGGCSPSNLCRFLFYSRVEL